MGWGRSAARVQKVQRVRPAFGRLVQRVVVAASPQIIKKGRGSAAGCVEGLHRFDQGATAPAALRVADCPAVHSEHILKER